MSYVLTVPEMLASAAADLTKIGTGVHITNVAAAGPTSGVVAAAGDEISAAAAARFNAYGQEYQAVMKQGAAFHNEFAQMLAVAGNTYTEIEAANAVTMSNASNTVNAPISPLLEQTTGSLINAGEPGTGDVAPRRITALIMGGTGNPLPNARYLADINNKFIQPLFPGAQAQGLATPQQFWPVTLNLGSLTFNQSVAQGVTELTNAVNTEIALGHKVVVFGYSQSATIVNNYINSLIATGAPHVNDLSFVTLANPHTPNGGLLSRFPGFHIPILDVPFNGATSPDSPYPTHIFTRQYDGIAHVPRYPLNVTASLNALMGFFHIHPDELLPANPIGSAVQLPTSPDYVGNTKYYMIPTQNLPLLQPIRNFPFIGPPVADLFQPPLRVLVDLGYGSYGPGLNYANIPTPAALWSIPNPLPLAYYLTTGVLQGPYGAAVGIGVQAGLLSSDSFPDAYPWAPSLNPEINLYFGQPQMTELSQLSGYLGDMLGPVPLVA